MNPYMTIKLKFIPQVGLKLGVIAMSLLMCVLLFGSQNIPLLASPQSGILALEGIVIVSILMSAVHIVLLTDKWIKTMSFFLRCFLAFFAAELVVCGCGKICDLFLINAKAIIILTAGNLSALNLSAVLTLKLQHGIGIRAFYHSIVTHLRNTVIAFTAALIIGMAAGFRGDSELEKPWDLPQIGVMQIDDPDKENISEEM